MRWSSDPSGSCRQLWGASVQKEHWIWSLALYDCNLEQVTEPLRVVQWDETRGSSKSRWETEDQRGGALLKITKQI